jgi:hypothetical protein
VTDTGVQMVEVRGSDGALSVAANVSLSVVAPPSVALNGVVQDGYIAGADIYLDANNNGVGDPWEKTGLKTDSKGMFSGTVKGEGKLIAIGGVNIDTGILNTLVLTAPEGSKVVSPITALAVEVSKKAGVSVDTAAETVMKSLGLSSSLDIYAFDPLADKTNPDALPLQKANVQIALVNTIAGESALSSMASTLIAGARGDSKLDLASLSTLQKIAPRLSSESLAALARANGEVSAAIDISTLPQVQWDLLTTAKRAGTDADDLLVGDSGNDSLSAGKGNDQLRGEGGSDKMDGGDGIDTAIFERSRASYKAETVLEDGITLWKVTDLETGDVDELRNIEKLQFAESIVVGYINPVQTEVSLDLTGTPSVTYRVYRAAFARDPDLGGLGYWLSEMEKYLDPSLSPEQNPYLLAVAKSFVESNEFKDKYGDAVTNDVFVLNLYRNVLGRDPRVPDPVTGKIDPGYAYWLDVLNKNNASRSDVFVYFSESAENKAAVAQVIASGIEYVPWPTRAKLTL